MTDLNRTALPSRTDGTVEKTADWLVDLGPEGGSKGGQIIANGTPEQVAEMPQSHTGHFLKPLLERDRA